MAGMNYFDSNRTNTVISKFEAVKVINLLRNFKNVFDPGASIRRNTVIFNDVTMDVDLSV